MADVILLSSDEEEDELPPKKRVKLTRVEDNLNCPRISESIILSDDDEDAQKTSEKEKTETNKMSDVLKVQDETNGEAKSVAKDPPSNNEEAAVDELEDTEAVCLDEVAAEKEENGVDLEDNKENNASEKSVEIETETDVRFREFCARCRDYIEKLDEKRMLNTRLDSLIKSYAKLKKYDALENFDRILQDQTKQMDCGSTPMVCFHSVFKWTLDKYQKFKNGKEKKDKLISQLENTLKQLSKRIEKLKEDEVDLNDDEGSSYVKCEAYERRSVQVHAKLCKLQGTDPNEGRITYLPLKFKNSTNSLINKAINHKYKDSNFLPDFYEFNKFLRKFAEKGGIKMNEERLKLEIKFCFEHLTKLIKKNRQRELYEVQKHFVQDKPDTTLHDSEFNAKIREGRQKSIKEMNEIMNKYVELQETGVHPSLSSDSDNSNFEEESE